MSPFTVRGKRRSSQNAAGHGLLASQIVVRDESPEDFEVVRTHLHLNCWRAKTPEGERRTIAIGTAC